MMPGVGLYLPETLHRSSDHSPERSEEDILSAQFSRKDHRASQETSASASTTSMDQKSTSSGIAIQDVNSTATVFDYADFVLTSKKRSTEAERFAGLIWRIRQDLAEVSRLYLSPTVTHFLDAWPDRKAWIDKILSDIRTVLVEIGGSIELVRIREDDGTTKMRRKFEYMLHHQKRLTTKQQTLLNCHQNLLGVVQVMQTVEQCAGLGGLVPDPIFEAPVRPWTRSDGDISRELYPLRFNSNDISRSDVTTSESSVTLHMNPSKAVLVELPGCTPDYLRLSRSQDNVSISEPRKLASFSSSEIRGISPTITEAPFHPRDNLSQGGQQNETPENSHGLPSNLLGHMSSEKYTSLYEAGSKTGEMSSSLNAVVDKIVERTQSFASTTASLKIPALPKRYRPRLIQVQKPDSRHHSSPSTLPPYQSQTSLAEDLKEYITHTAASEQLTKTTSSQTSSLSSTTGSRAPRRETMKMLASFPVVREDSEHPEQIKKALHDQSAVTEEGDATVHLDCQSIPSEHDGLSTSSEHTRSRKDTTQAPNSPPPSLQSTSSSITVSEATIHEELALASSLQLPPSQPNSPPLKSANPSQNGRTISPQYSVIRERLLPSTWQEKPEPLTGNNVSVHSPSHIPDNDPGVHAPEFPQPSQQPSPPPPPSLQMATQILKGKTLQHAERTRQLSLQSVDSASTPPQPPSISNQDTSVQLSPPDAPSQPRSIPPVPTTPAVGSGTGDESPKPRTAEAKRRAAHARRMKIAFGDSDEVA